MARRIGRADAGDPLSNLIIGSVLLFISATLEQSVGGRAAAYVGVGGIFMIGRGLYEIYSKYKKKSFVAKIVDGYGYNYPSVKLNTEAAWYLFERGLRFRKYYDNYCTFIFESSVPKENIDLETLNYPTHKIVNNFTDRSNIQPDNVQTVKDNDIGRKDEKYLIDYGVFVTLNIRGSYLKRDKNAERLEKLLTEIFREVDDEYMESLGFSPNKNFIFDYNPKNKIKLDDVENRLVNQQSTRTRPTGNLRGLG